MKRFAKIAGLAALATVAVSTAAYAAAPETVMAAVHFACECCGIACPCCPK